MWIFFSIGAYFLLAINGVADKFLLSKSVKHPVAYAFYGGITGPLTFLLSIFGLFGSWLGWSFLSNEFSFQWLTLGQTLVAIIGGASFPLALYFSYSAIQKTSVSRVLPIQGGFVPVFTLLFAYLFLGERLDASHLISFMLLVLGAVVISFRKEQGHWHARAFNQAFISAVLFSLCAVLTKYAFLRVNFASGLIWTRLGFFLVSISFLLIPKAREYIFNAPKETTVGSKFVYLGARISGGVSGFLQNYAVKLGSVTLVNAMQGTQYVFLLILTTILSLKFPKILKEHLSGQSFAQKIISIILVSVGLVLLVT
jgi:drug/metabolite transporter (DMT)-like permease